MRTTTSGITWVVWVRGLHKLTEKRLDFSSQAFLLH